MSTWVGLYHLPSSPFGLHLVSELSWMVIPIVVLPRSPLSMAVVGVLGFELVVVGGVPVVIEALW